LIDIHCHILPDVDDGAVDMEESLAMAEKAAADGIRIIVATPHTLNGRYINPSDKVMAQVRNLQSFLLKAKSEINIVPGAEIHFCLNLKERILSREALTLNDTGKYLLVEFPFQTLPPQYREELFRLKIEGITPIIAHPERNAVFQQHPEMLEELVAAGCLLQITAMSITGGFGEDVMECAANMLKFRMAHIIATDAHSAGNRSPILSYAVAVATQVMGNRTDAELMVTRIPEAILAGKPVEIPEPPRAVLQKKSGFLKKIGWLT
jgi:protein-tyrosine phosphatase